MTWEMSRSLRGGMECGWEGLDDGDWGQGSGGKGREGEVGVEGDGWAV